VTIAGHHQRLTGLHRRHHCDVHIFGAAVSREQRLIGAHGLGEQFHRGRLHLPGLVAIIHSIVHADVGTKRLLACPAARDRLRFARPGPVSRYAECEIPASVEVLDRFADWCGVGLIADGPGGALLLGLLDVFLALLIDPGSERTTT
jgi:hypothetical protein